MKLDPNEIFEFFYFRRPKKDELEHFMELNGHFEREYKMVPEACRESVPEFFGFLELLEHEFTDSYDNFWFLFPLKIENGGIRITRVRRHNQYIYAEFDCFRIKFRDVNGFRLYVTHKYVEEVICK